MSDNREDLEGRIAIIGMAGRFPGSSTLESFWEHLRDGVEAVQYYSEDELLANGEPLDLIRDPAYVPASAPLDGIDQFDASFFGMSPRDAAVFDPQHRIFLECAWEVFEHAGYVSDRITGAVGVFASCGLSEYMFKNVLANAQVKASVGEWLVRHTGNDTNFLATRVSYELNLTGPSLNVQTACSSSLVALHLACQSLLSGECDLALAGGAVVAPVQRRGYLYKEGEILSPDGHCRAFDEKSAGTIISSAAGCVLLKPLADALADGDNVLAVVRGSAINNDGRDKVGYLAPSVGGQARVVTEALAMAGVDAREVSYIEAHGTGTLIGDPIEIAGLTQAYRSTTADTQFCAIGSLKSNIGHTGEAAGVAGLIKTVLALQHRQLPPSLHYQSPNPQADFPNSPFYVNGELTDWTVADGATRIAGITGLGAGGTNAHVLIEQAPEAGPPDRSRTSQLITVSARTATALQHAVEQLAEFLNEHPDIDLADVAYTRFVGRKDFRCRQAVVATSPAGAAAALAVNEVRSSIKHHVDGEPPSVVFMMPGGGSQYAAMGIGLYETEPVYRDAVDHCCDFVAATFAIDLRSSLFPVGDLDAASKVLERPSVALPALFTTEYALAKLLESWGVVPSAMIGHSAGEYVVACLAGVISVTDGLSLVAVRGRLFETLPAGGMLSVSLSEADLRSRLPEAMSIAASNAAELCVAAGPLALIDELEASLTADEIDCARVHIDVAAHSSMLEPILAEFEAFCRTINFSSPTIPYISNLTGTWVTAEEATDPSYWVRHLRHTIRFGDGIDTILQDPNRVLVEVGPGRTLSSLSRLAPNKPVGITPTLRHPNEAASDDGFILAALGRLWVAGVAIDADKLYAGETRCRVPMPTYPFERQRYWIDADPVDASHTRTTGVLRKQSRLSDWFYTPAWKRSVVAADSISAPHPTWLIVGDGAPIVEALSARLRAAGDQVIGASFGDGFQRSGEARFVVRPWMSSDWEQLIEGLRDGDCLPDHVVHITAVGSSRGRHRFGLKVDRIAAFEHTVERDQEGLIALARALSNVTRPIRLSIVTSGVCAVGAETNLVPERALLHGAARVIPRELPNVSTIAIDIDHPHRGGVLAETSLRQLERELRAGSPEDLVALRDGQRWVREFEPIALPKAEDSPWRSDGVYLITGGLGGIGRAVGERIAEHAPGSTLVLVGRTPMPAESTWTMVLADDGTDAGTRSKITSVQRMQASGATVVLVSADVTDQEAMSQIVAHIHSTQGNITGVIHSAGVLDDALITLRSPALAAAVVDVKAKGLLVLDRVLAKSPPELLVLFSSVSSLLGLPGQVDYTAASTFLDAYAIANDRNGSTRVISVNWNAWQEVGMAVDVVRDNAHKAKLAASPSSPVQLFDRVIDDDDRTTFATAFSRQRHWLLDEHVVRGGEAIIPGTGYLELLRSAAAHRAAEGDVELRNVHFLSPFVVAANEVRVMTLTLDHSAATAVVFSDSDDSPHVSAEIAIVAASAPQHLDIDAIRARCQRLVERFDGYSEQPFMQFGPRWGNLRSVEYGESEALITTVMPSGFVDELNDLWLHPAMLDMLTGSAQALIPGFSPSESFFAPLSYERVHSLSPIPADAISHVRRRNTQSEDLAIFDITICAADGTEVAAIDGFTMRRVRAGAQLTARRAPQERGLASAVGESSVTNAVSEGILPTEGVDALDRILFTHAGPQVVASSVDLHQWIANVDAESSQADRSDDDTESSGPQFMRPEISSAFEEPATPIERELAAMWQDLLGVNQVGRHDDFFELGGQSLVAVRLFTRMRKRYAVDLPLSTLFEASTIAQCSALIAEAAGIDDRETTAAPSAEFSAGTAGLEPATRARRRYLVAMNESSHPDATPLFVVCGMKGNVLNFRELAHKVARDRPFYGIQARGLLGNEEPYQNFREMAEAYLAEIREVQPTGPYLLGGYSAGGVAALEMAQQLRDAGETVDLIVMFDSWRPQAIQMTAIEKARFHWKRLRSTGIGYVKQWVVNRIEWEQARRPNRGLSRDSVDEMTYREVSIMSGFSTAIADYVPRHYPGEIMLFRPPLDPWIVFGPDRQVDSSRRFMFDDSGWGAFCDHVTVFEVTGDHDSMFVEPYVETLAAHLHDYVDGRTNPTRTG